MNENGVGMKLFSVNIGKNQVSLAADMGAEIRKYWNAADIATTRSEGSPSSDGRYWCLLARDSTRLENPWRLCLGHATTTNHRPSRYP